MGILNDWLGNADQGSLSLDLRGVGNLELAWALLLRPMVEPFAGVTGV